MFSLLHTSLSLIEPKMKIAESANSLDPGEVAHYVPTHLDLHCLSSTLNSNIGKLGQNSLCYFAT